MHTKYLCAYVLIAFLGLAFLAAALSYFKTDWRVKTWLSGKATASYERDFDKNLAHRDQSIHKWNKIAHSVFGEGKEGVLIGEDNWLFTNEEFAYEKDFQKRIHERKDYILSVSKDLKENNVKLLIVPIPSKARVYQDKLGRYKFPEYWKLQYNYLLDFFEKNDIEFVNLLSVFNKQKNNNIYLKTDTHWTPMGARLAALNIEQAITKGFPYFSWDITNFTSQKGDLIEHEGDLMRYTTDLEKDKFNIWSTIAKTTSNDDLFGEVELPITLVGTSYSANKLWNFDGFLKEILGTDILNVADEGLGPFEVMDNYLKSDAYINTKPKLVIWEMPERYLAVTPNQ